MATYPMVFGVPMIPPQPTKKKIMKPKKGGWTDEQIELLIKLYPYATTKELIATLGKSKRAIYARANLLKLKKFVRTET